MAPIDRKRFSVSEPWTVQPLRNPKPLRRKRRGNFIKGPIPLEWIGKAAQLPGKALHVAIALYYLAGMKCDREVVLTGTVLKTFGVERHASYRGLKALETAGLVSVQRHAGRNPIVTILDSSQFH